MRSHTRADKAADLLRQAKRVAHRAIDRAQAPLQPLGMHPLPQPAAIRGLPRFIRDWRAYNRLIRPTLRLPYGPATGCLS